MNISGIKVQTNPLLVESFQCRFPRSKSKRIVKKWRKDARNWKTVPSKKVLHFAQTNTIICHPSLLPALEKAVQFENERMCEINKKLRAHKFEEPVNFGAFRFQVPFGFKMPPSNIICTDCA